MFAFELIETVTVVLAPAASVPDAPDNVSQLCVFAAVQLMPVPPVFIRVYVCELGENGPPRFPALFKPVAGVTDNVPAVLCTVTVTVSVAVFSARSVTVKV